jgi:hypothetical protein
MSNIRCIRIYAVIYDYTVTAVYFNFRNVYSARHTLIMHPRNEGVRNGMRFFVPRPRMTKLTVIKRKIWS